jgi:hypothetical protein
MNARAMADVFCWHSCSILSYTKMLTLVVDSNLTQADTPQPRHKVSRMRTGSDIVAQDFDLLVFQVETSLYAVSASIILGDNPDTRCHE